jgi:hypothetical protein
LFLSVNGYKNGVINLAWRSDVPAALVRLIEEMLVKEREGRMSLGDALPGRMRQVAAELDKIRDSV